jgi:hypothetical protein
MLYSLDYRYGAATAAEGGGGPLVHLLQGRPEVSRPPAKLTAQTNLHDIGDSSLGVFVELSRFSIIF